MEERSGLGIFHRGWSRQSRRRAGRAMDFGYATRVSTALGRGVCYCLLFKTSPNDSEQHDGNDSSPSQEGFMESKLT
jgi:hypothetical protein